MVSEAVRKHAPAANNACHCEERSDVAIRFPLPTCVIVPGSKRRTDCDRRKSPCGATTSVRAGLAMTEVWGCWIGFAGVVTLCKMLPRGRIISAPTVAAGILWGLPRQCAHWLAMTVLFNRVKVPLISNSPAPGRSESCTVRNRCRLFPGVRRGCRTR